jgi:mono/diheme cytochrome c family protein
MENDFSVQTHESVLKGSWNGTVVEPGDPNGSYLVELIESGEMPNKGPRLLPAEIAAIRAWIEAGAPDN